MLRRIKTRIPAAKTKIGSKEDTSPDSIIIAPVNVELEKNVKPKATAKPKAKKIPMLLRPLIVVCIAGLNILISNSLRIKIVLD